MRARPPHRLRAVPAAFLLLALPTVALAADDAAAAAKAAGPETPGHVLGAILLALLLFAGIGCAVAVFRVVLAGPTARAEEALERLGLGRLLLAGVLPVVGASLLGAAARASGVEALEWVWAVLVLVPVLLLSFVGALAAIPHLGGKLLLPGREHSLLARALLGSIVLGAATGVLGWALRQAGVILFALLLGWFLGAGVGVLFRRVPGGPEENG